MTHFEKYKKMHRIGLRVATESKSGIFYVHNGGWWNFPMRVFNIGGITLGLDVYLNSSCQNYKEHYTDLVEHEMEHVRQYLTEGLMFYVKYLTGHAAKYEAEAEAKGKTR